MAIKWDEVDKMLGIKEGQATKTISKGRLDWDKVDTLLEQAKVSTPQPSVPPISQPLPQPTPVQQIAPQVSDIVSNVSRFNPIQTFLRQNEQQRGIIRSGLESKPNRPYGINIAGELGADIVDLFGDPKNIIAGAMGSMATEAGIAKLLTNPKVLTYVEKNLPTLLKVNLEKFRQNIPKVTSNIPQTIPKEITPITPKVPEMVGSIRTSKFPSEVQPTIVESGIEKPPVRTFAQQRIVAEQLKPMIDLDTIQPMQIMQTETRRAAGLQWIENAKSALKSGSKEDMLKVYTQLNKLNEVHSEAGRLLGSLRDPLFDMDNEAIKLVSEGMQKVIPEAKDSLAKFLKQASQPGLWDKFMEYRTASLLTSPYTHERNIIGNIVGRVFKIPERVIAGGADAINATIKGQTRERFATEAIADIVGWERGLRLGIKNGFKALFNEEFLMSKSEAPRFAKAIPGVIGKFIRMPFRALNAMDEVFSSWAKTSDLYSQSYRQAILEKAPDIFSRTAELVSKPSFEMIARANNEALKQTFRQPLGLAGKSIQLALTKSKVGKFIVPFFKTPVNLFKWSFDRSPLGIYKLATPSFYNLPPGQMADEIGKMAFGQMISGGIVYEAYQGNITGRLSNKKTEREALMRQGIMPYSIKIGNKYVSYRGYEPMASWLALLANSTEQWKEKDREPFAEEIIPVLLETVKFMREQPFLQSVKDLFNALDDPEKMGQQFIQNIATGVTVPTGIGYVARLLDPTIRETDTIPEAIKARIPGLSKKLQPKLDVWGRPITKEGTLMERAFNPSGVVTEKPDLTEQELLSLEKFPAKITKKYKGLPLSIDERNIITRVEGGITKKLLDNLIILPEYKNLDKFEREDIVDKLIRKIRTEVRKTFFEKKIIGDLNKFNNREEKIKYIQNLLDKKIIKP